MRRILLCGALLLAACAREILAPLGANGAHHVLVTVTVPGQCLVGGCDPPGGDRTHLGLIRVLNTGTATAYLQACGQGSAFAEEQLVNGTWTFTGPAISCAITPGPIVVAPGDSVRQNWFFASGTCRMVIGVGTTPALSDSELDVSAAVTIP